MNKHITASPLYWPEGWKKTNAPIRSQFANHSIAKATRFIIAELDRMGIGGWNVIISTDLHLRNDGLPYSTQRDPENKGVAVWWKDDDEQRVIALDKYDRIADNMRAIGKTIEAMRGIQRWGGGEILNRTFAGFVSLPSPESERSWRDVLDYHGDNFDEATAKYIAARICAHPDKGGTSEKFNEVTEAWEQCQEELN